MSQSRPAVERRHPPDSLMRLVNPLTRRLVQRRFAPGEVAVLHMTGRKSGRPYAVPVGYRVIDGEECVFTSSRWRHNLRGVDIVEVTRRGRRHPMRLQVVDDPDAVAEILTRLIEEHGAKWAGQRLGIRINVPRPPTRTEVKRMVEECGFAILWLQPA